MSETRKLAAILVADVVSYGRLAGADEAHAGVRAAGGSWRRRRLAAFKKRLSVI